MGMPEVKRNARATLILILHYRDLCFPLYQLPDVAKALCYQAYLSRKLAVRGETPRDLGLIYPART
jgi:hypothetical protein